MKTSFVVRSAVVNPTGGTRYAVPEPEPILVEDGDEPTSPVEPTPPPEPVRTVCPALVVTLDPEQYIIGPYGERYNPIVCAGVLQLCIVDENEWAQFVVGRNFVVEVS